MIGTGEAMEQYNRILRHCTLFRNIEDGQMAPLMQCLNAQIKAFKNDEYIFLSGDIIDFVGVILTGTVEIIKENLAGNKHIVAVLGPSDLFAEGIVCTATRISPVSVRVKEDAKILVIPYERVIRSCGNSCNFHVTLIQNMMVVLGERNVKLNRKMELLILKGMREKLVSYLLAEAAKSNDYVFRIMLNRIDLAEFLNVSRTSMCRELTRMKNEGLIDYYGNSFKILDKQRMMSYLEGK